MCAADDGMWNGINEVVIKKKPVIVKIAKSGMRRNELIVRKELKWYGNEQE